MKGTLVRLLVILLISASGVTLAQKHYHNAEVLERAKVNSMRNLDSEINGVVESTLFGIMLMKKYYPAEDYSELFEEVNRISAEGSTPEIRLKAQLTGMYLSFPELFSEVKFEDKENPGKYFAKISDNLKENLLTIR